MTITINGINYRAEKMSPREQFHVTRRLTPLLGPLGPTVLELLDDDKSRAEVLANIVHSIGPLAEALAGMADETLDYVLDGCLFHVKREDLSSGWHPIYVRDNRPGQPALRMFADIDGAAELRLAAEVLKFNLSGFFSQLSDEPASSLGAPNQAGTSQNS